MIVFSEKQKIQEYINRLLDENYTIGLVPTMGALHLGHISLIEEALKENACVVVSIFVNPTQFDNGKDLENYPRTFDRDTKLLEKISKDIIVYAPTVNDIYGKNIVSKQFDFSGLELQMEGKFRTGHFNGVGTIVKRLFEVVRPTTAYFGEKDFQQLQIIKKLVEKEQLPVIVKGCEIYRENTGLAMSSRNERLKPNYKEEAPFIYNTLKIAKKLFSEKNIDEITNWVDQQFTNHKFLELEYFTIADEVTLKPLSKKSKQVNCRAFIAAYADDVRLIDNIALN